MILRLRNDVAAALLAGGVSALLLLGALASQYWGGLAPCEICIWQRWPHLASAIIGLVGGALLSAKILPARLGNVIAILAILAIAVSGAIGVYHAGVEWKWWEGPSACTNLGYTHGPGISFEPIPTVSCDEAAWRLFGLSLAGYNALISFAVAVGALWLLFCRKKSA
jgi:disulfide bond formation protein DsbB